MAPRSTRRPFGQHFLADRAAVARIVGAAAIEPGASVFEIGPGRGALTGALVEAAGRIAAVEIDRRLTPALARRFPPERLVLFERSVLDLPLSEVAETLSPDGAALIVVGNLPYDVSKPIVGKLLAERDRVARAVLMFQREVAERLTASPGNKQYGPLGILAGLDYRIERRFDLSPRAFRPPPRVVSSVTVWTPRDPAPEPALRTSLRATLAAAFAHRRRTLRNNLRAAFGEAEADAALSSAEIDGALRAERVSPDELSRLAKALRSAALV